MYLLFVLLCIYKVSPNSVDIENSPILPILTGTHLRKRSESRHIFSSLLHNNSLRPISPQPDNRHNRHGQSGYQSGARRQSGNRHNKHGQPQGQSGARRQPDNRHNRDGKPRGQYGTRRQPGNGHNKHGQPEGQSGARRQPDTK